MSEGWIKLHREIMDNPVFRKPTVSHYFSYCLLKANHEDKETIWNGKKMLIERGSFMTGRKQAAKDTGLSEQNIRTALTILELQGILQKSTTKSTNRFTYLTICNYDKYQGRESKGNHQTNHQSTSNQPQTRTNKNEKNNIYDEKFNKFWKAYPLRVGKLCAAKAFKKINPDTTLLELMIKKIEEKKLQDDWQNSKGQFIPYPAKWLNDRRWEDEEIILPKREPRLVL